jgi:hypothetical protein
VGGCIFGRPANPSVTPGESTSATALCRRNFDRFPKRLAMGPVPNADALKVLNSYFAWRRTPEGEAWAK